MYSEFKSKKFSTTKGIITKISNSGDSDKMLTILTTKGEKMSVIIKGARKSNSKRSSSLELANSINIQTINGYGIAIAGEIQLLNSFVHWKDSLPNSMMLQLICEVCNVSTTEGMVDSSLYKNLHSILKTIPNSNYTSVAYYILSILKLTGNLPSLENCILSGAPLFSSSVGILEHTIGFVQSLDSAKIVSPNVYKAIRYCLENGLGNAIAVSLSKNESAELIRIFLDWFELSFETKLKSKKIVIQILGY